MCKHLSDALDYSLPIQPSHGGRINQSISRTDEWNFYSLSRALRKRRMKKPRRAISAKI